MTPEAPFPADLTLAVGDSAEIPLQSYAGSGNAWSVGEGADQHAASIRVEAESPPRAEPAEPGVSEPPGTSVPAERAVVTARAPGEATFQLVLSRPFGPPEPALTRDVRVTVVERPEGAGG